MAPRPGVSNGLAINFYGPIRTPSIIHWNTLAGRQFSTSDITSAVRSLCVAAGLDPLLYSSHSLRIGGATDLAMPGGTEVECRMAGRWHSDVWAIYARPCLAMQLASSIRLCLAESVDVE